MTAVDLSASTSEIRAAEPAVVKTDRFGNIIIELNAWDARHAATIAIAVASVDSDGFHGSNDRRTSVQVFIPLVGLEGGVLPDPKPGVKWAPYVQTLTHNGLIYDPRNRVPPPFSAFGGAHVVVVAPSANAPVGEVLCTRKHGELKYGAVGGAQDHGENLVDTAKREVAEELGLDPARLDEFWRDAELSLISGYTQTNARNYGGVKAADTCLFFALNVTKEKMAEFMTAAIDVGEIAEVVWIPAQDLNASNTYGSFMNAITTLQQVGSIGLHLTMVGGNARYSW